MKFLLFLCAVADINAQLGGMSANGIMDGHNALRGAIAKGEYVVKGVRKPSASDMQMMIYNFELGRSAQVIASQCPTDTSSKPGMNIYSYTASSFAALGSIGPYGRKAADHWAKQFQDYGWPTNFKTEDTRIAAATQMAYSKANRVGCGFNYCGNDRNRIVIVCLYNAIPVSGQSLYQSGKVCAACSSQQQCEYGGLCL